MEKEIGNYNKLTMRKKLEGNGISSWALENKFVQNSSGASSILKKGHVYAPEYLMRNQILEDIASASSENRYDDLDKIGQKLNYAIDNEFYGISIADLQFRASQKMKQIYNEIGEYTGE